MHKRTVAEVMTREVVTALGIASASEAAGQGITRLNAFPARIG